MAQLDIDRIQADYITGLREGRLLLQRCTCGELRLPPRTSCAACLSLEWVWCAAEGGGVLRSWVVYHVAFHPDFAGRLPYNVALVELDEGPRMITNIVDGNEQLRADARVSLVKQEASDTPLARFKLVE